MKATAARYTALQVERHVRLGAFLLVFSSALALALTQRMLPSATVLGGALLVAWFWPRRTGRSIFWEAASFLYLLFFFVDLFRISGSLAPSLVHLFTFILINKLFNLNTPRDYYQLFLLTFLTILAATSLSIEIEMLYMIVLYIILLVWNIASFTLYQEWRRESSDTYFPVSLFSARYWLMVFAASVVTFLIALGIFFLLPRMQLGYLSQFNPGRVQYVSGFSQKVTLGDINSIQDDPNLAMRVRVTPGAHAYPPLQLYWRGIAFDHYDGVSWSSTIPGTRFLYHDSGDFYYAVRHSGSLDTLVRQEVFMEPLATRVIFGLDKIVRIHGQIGEVSRDPNNTLMAMAQLKSYEVYSRISPVRVEELRKEPLEVPEQVRQYYLQLPFRSERIAVLARRITSSATTNVDRVMLLRQYLQKNYEYSTTELPMNGADPVSEFLFVSRSGHCEYFATALVILLRHLDIPARLVNGFREGEFNELGGFYMVRNSDAHSWTEVYAGDQWITVDPSPIADPLAGGSLSAFFNPRKVLDSISFFWDRYILIFSGQDQMDAILSARDRFREMRTTIRRNYEAAPQRLSERAARFWKDNRWTLSLSLGAAILALAAFRIWLRRRRNLLLSRTPVLFYQEMLSILERKGFARQPQVTPAEFIRSIEPQIPTPCRPDLRSLTELFYRARFGSYHLTPSDQSGIRASLRRLEQM